MCIVNPPTDLHRLDVIFGRLRQCVGKTGNRKPHKPLLILYALGKLKANHPRLMVYNNVLENELTNLLDKFGPPTKPQNPHEPFKRLRNDGKNINEKIWELQLPEPLNRLSEREINGLDKSQLKEYQVEGGFLPEVYELFLEQPVLIEIVVQHLLNAHWPSPYHWEIRREVGLELTVTSPLPDDYSLRDWLISVLGNGRKGNQTFIQLIDALFWNELRKRDPQFRKEVRLAYDDRCCVCDAELRLDEEIIDLEAAHIKWFAAGGPNTVRNGLLLCGFHHNTFDRGAWCLEYDGEPNYRVNISELLNGPSESIDLLGDFQDKRISLPRKQLEFPKKDFIEWHQKQVFKS